jgi:glycosyltransferase involved in cell wall biosynthesis
MTQADPADAAGLFEKVRVIRNGVSRTWSGVTPEAAAAAAKLVGDVPYLLCVGNGKPHKNLKFAMAVANSLTLGGFRHRLVIVGPPDPYLLDWLDAERPSAHRVLRIDRVEAPVLAALYHKADVLLTPSLYEGFGLPPLEAMMAGTPVVASNRGGLPESVGSAAAGGLLDPLDLKSWQAEVMRLITDRDYREARITAGRKWARSMNWDRATQDLAREFISVSTASSAEATNSLPRWTRTTSNQSTPSNQQMADGARDVDEGGPGVT